MDGKPIKKLSKLQIHNTKLASQLADANKRIARLRFERGLLLDKLYELEKQNNITRLNQSSDSETEMREEEWWHPVDVASVLARNPIGALPAVQKPAKPSNHKKKRKSPLDLSALTTSDDDLTDQDDTNMVAHSGMLFEFDNTPVGLIGSSPPGKKQRRSNKASSADTVLKTLPVEYDSDGKPQLPITVGVVTVEELGEIVFDRPAYHNRRYILPVGFHSTRSYLSTVDPNNQTTYHSRILDGGAAPIFQVTGEDNPGAVFQAPTSTGAWSAVVKAANLIRMKEFSNSASGPDYYGLSNATVAMLIEDLPNSDRCINYLKKRFERGAAHVKKPLSVIDANNNSNTTTTNSSIQQPNINNMEPPQISSGLASEGNMDESTQLLETE